MWIGLSSLQILDIVCLQNIISNFNRILLEYYWIRTYVLYLITLVTLITAASGQFFEQSTLWQAIDVHPSEHCLCLVASNASRDSMLVTKSLQ